MVAQKIMNKKKKNHLKWRSFLLWLGHGVYLTTLNILYVVSYYGIVVTFLMIFLMKKVD